MCKHPGRITQRLVEVAQDPQAGFLPAALDDLAAHCMLEPSRAQTSSAVEVTAITVQDHPHRRDPGLGPEGLLGYFQRGRPHAFEQVADLLDLAARVGDQLLAAGTQVPQPTPRLIDRFGDVAAQLRGQPGDQNRVLVVGLVERQVLTAPSPRGLHRLHTHERHRPVRSALTKTRHRCPVGSHDTVTPANPFAVARSAAQSNATPRSQARQRNVLRARTLESWSVTTTICFLSARSIPTIAFSSGTSTRSRASRALRFRSPRETPLPWVMNVLLVRWDTKPDKRIRGTFQHHDRHAERLSMPRSALSDACTDTSSSPERGDTTSRDHAG